MLRIQNLYKSYVAQDNASTRVFDNLNLEVAKGEFISIVGPNGCGKTTLLLMLAGILEPDSGTIQCHQHPVHALNIGLVFQNYGSSLLPWLTVKDNIAFPLRLKRLPRAERDKHVSDLCHRFDCAIPLEAYPYTLSGGQQQLASLLRGLIIEPELYLFDEPFSSLDYETTLTMLQITADMWNRSRVTTLLVSHDIDEAIFLAHRIIVLSHKPVRVVGDFRNPLPFPRMLEMIGGSEFASLKKEVLSAYRQEISKPDTQSSRGDLYS